MRKVFEGYKLIDTNDIDGRRLMLENKQNMRDFRLARRRIYREGITEPFEVIKRGNRYILRSNPIDFIAAKSLDYSIVPCLIRNPKYEFILHRTLRDLDMD